MTEEVSSGDWDISRSETGLWDFVASSSFHVFSRIFNISTKRCANLKHRTCETVQVELKQVIFSKLCNREGRCTAICSHTIVDSLLRSHLRLYFLCTRQVDPQAPAEPTCDFDELQQCSNDIRFRREVWIYKANLRTKAHKFRALLVRESTDDQYVAFMSSSPFFIR